MNTIDPEKQKGNGMRTSASRGLFFCHSDSKRDGKYLWGSQILCKWPRPGEYFYLFLVWLTYIVKDFNFLYVRTFWPQLKSLQNENDYPMLVTDAGHRFEIWVFVILVTNNLPPFQTYFCYINVLSQHYF